MNKYYLGNCLRGYFEGEFDNIEDAWMIISARFLLSYPSSTGRRVFMYIEKTNEYGFEDEILCKQGVTPLKGLYSKEEIMKRAKRAKFFYR